MTNVSKLVLWVTISTCGMRAVVRLANVHNFWGPKIVYEDLLDMQCNRWSRFPWMRVHFGEMRTVAPRRRLLSLSDECRAIAGEQFASRIGCSYVRRIVRGSDPGSRVAGGAWFGSPEQTGQLSNKWDYGERIRGQWPRK